MSDELKIGWDTSQKGDESAISLVLGKSVLTINDPFASPLIAEFERLLALGDENTDLRALLDRAAEDLEFYGEKINYCRVHNINMWATSDIDLDDGKRARETLSAIQASKART